MAKKPLESIDDYLARYPRICAHIIAESLGYATPSCAAGILRDAKQGNPNWCEWVCARYNAKPKPVVRDAIRNRGSHKGFMASYDLAMQIVRRQLDAGNGPELASWF